MNSLLHWYQKEPHHLSHAEITNRDGGKIDFYQLISRDSEV